MLASITHLEIISNSIWIITKISDKRYHQLYSLVINTRVTCVPNKRVINKTRASKAIATFNINSIMLVSRLIILILFLFSWIKAIHLNWKWLISIFLPFDMCVIAWAFNKARHFYGSSRVKPLRQNNLEVKDSQLLTVGSDHGCVSNKSLLNEDSIIRHEDPIFLEKDQCAAHRLAQAHKPSKKRQAHSRSTQASLQI